MATIEHHAPGAFCWSELGTTDPQAAKAFYGRLFHWAPKDIPMGDGSYYSILQAAGNDAAGLYGLRGEQRRQGVAPYSG
jgi:uncharacterized protein